MQLCDWQVHRRISQVHLVSTKSKKGAALQSTCYKGTSQLCAAPPQTRSHRFVFSHVKVHLAAFTQLERAQNFVEVQAAGVVPAIGKEQVAAPLYATVHTVCRLKWCVCCGCRVLCGVCGCTERSPAEKLFLSRALLLQAPYKAAPPGVAPPDPPNVGRQFLEVNHDGGKGVGGAASNLHLFGNRVCEA